MWRSDRWEWGTLLVSVAVCAASGLVYELALLSLSTSLNGGEKVETSLIVSGYVGATVATGLLVGAEVPLLMTLTQQGRLVDARSAGALLSTLNFADYFDALVGGLAWPFLLLPTLGMMCGTLAAGMVNLVAALFLALVLLRRFLP